MGAQALREGIKKEGFICVRHFRLAWTQSYKSEGLKDERLDKIRMSLK